MSKAFEKLPVEDVGLFGDLICGIDGVDGFRLAMDGSLIGF